MEFTLANEASWWHFKVQIPLLSALTFVRPLPAAELRRAADSSVLAPKLRVDLPLPLVASSLPVGAYIAFEFLPLAPGDALAATTPVCTDLAPTGTPALFTASFESCTLRCGTSRRPRCTSPQPARPSPPACMRACVPGWEGSGRGACRAAPGSGLLLVDPLGLFESACACFAWVVAGVGCLYVFRAWLIRARGWTETSAADRPADDTPVR